MTELFNRLPSLYDPVTLGLLLPLALAFVLTGLMRLAIGPRGRAVASAAVIVAVLAVHSLMAGVPALPPSGPADKAGWLIVAGLILGLLLDLFRPPRPLAWAAVAAWPAAVLGWIGLDTLLSIPRLAAADPGGALESLLLIALFVGFWVAGSTVLTRLRATDDASAAIMLAVAAGGLGLVLVGVGAFGLPMLALSAATVGFLLWNIGRTRFPFGDAAIFGGVGGLLATGTMFALSADSAVVLVVLALLVLVFFADRTARRVPSGGGVLGRFAAHLVLTAIAAVPALAALAVALLAL